MSDDLASLRPALGGAALCNPVGMARQTRGLVVSGKAARMRHSPYEGLDARAYWRTGVAQAHIAQAPEMDLYRPKFKIRASDRVFTAGSCFAQHIARNMRKWGLSVIDREPAPLGLPRERHRDYGYGLYSARHGNIYTTRQFLQLTQEACGRS